MFDDDYKDENESAVESVKVAETENKPIIEDVKTESEEIKIDKINKVEIHQNVVKHELEDQLETKIEMEPEFEAKPETEPKLEALEFELEIEGIEVKNNIFFLT
jgi:hypothetical protein